MSNRESLKKEFEQILKIAPKYNGNVKEYTSDNVNYGIIEKNTTYNPKIIVTQNDCLVDVYNQNDKTLLVNSASRLNQGGGVVNGSSAQEEHLCRNSNLYFALGNTKYPINTKIIKGILYTNIDIRSNKNLIDVVSLYSCPINNLPQNYNSTTYHFECFKCLWKIIQDTKPNKVVLVPIGCGVFGHKPQFIKNALKNVIDTYETPLETKEIIISCYTGIDNFREFNKLSN